jgi:uncharacterized protein (DUF2237 family)
MSEATSKEKNVLGGELLACSFAPLTGYFRDGSCATYGGDGVAHLVCVRVTAEFLAFSVERGNDLVTPLPEMRFKGLSNTRWISTSGSWAIRAAGAPSSSTRSRWRCSRRRWWPTCAP